MDCKLKRWEWHTQCAVPPTYVDGSEVRPGDSVRYRQAPGGLMAPSGDWTYGTAVVSDHCSGTLDLAGDDGRFYHLFGHIIERAEVSA